MSSGPHHFTTHDCERVEPELGKSANVRWLLIIDDGSRGTKLLPLGEAVTAGRDPSCELVLDHASVSRRHARFEPVGDQLRVLDLGSRNGISVEGTRVEQALLSARTRVTLGALTITAQQLELGGRAAPSFAHRPRAPGQRMKELEAMIDRVAPRELSVLVIGETGAGKERVARALHEQSPRRAGPLRVVNCGAIPATLLEGLLFGHERGAFTGADRPKPGLFEEAEGGTVFLDEVGELSAQAQAALLRVLESRTVTRLGAVQERPVNVRVVAATHRDLAGLIDKGDFRLDLYHRLNAVTLKVPPLRERADELEALSESFLADAASLWKVNVPAVSPEVYACFARYAWPGNVRELRNVMERALALCDHGTIDLTCLPEHVRGALDAGHVPLRPPAEVGTGPREVAEDVRGHMRAEELRLVRLALERSGGRKAEAAASLGMPIRTFRRRLRELSSQGED